MGLYYEDPLSIALHEYVKTEYADLYAIAEPDYQKAQVCGPHCDSNILHAPGECEYCDMHPDVQDARIWLNIAFSGRDPVQGQRPCPAEVLRSRETMNRWGGNVAQPKEPV